MQGRSVLPYALSELIDNALMATKSNRASRQVVITLALSGGSSPQSGLIAVWDNGEECRHSFCCPAPSSSGPVSQLLHRFDQVLNTAQRADGPTRKYMLLLCCLLPGRQLEGCVAESGS